MAHELYTDASGKTAFAYIGEHAWHGLGKQLTENAPLTVWRDEAGFNWEIKQNDAMTQLPDGNLLKMPERQLLYRSDTLAPLAVVSAKYRVVQPIEILHFYEDLIESAGFKLETAGMLFGGRRFWALAATNYSDEVIAGDKVAQYLLLTTACDGSLATTAKFTSVRVVCNNTLGMSLRQDGQKTQIKVPHSAQFDASSVKQSLGIAGETWGLFLEDMRFLASKPMAKNESILFLRDLIGDPEKSLQDQAPGAANLMQEVYALYDQTSMGNEIAGHTRWGMLNAITEYADWHTGHKTADARMNSAWFGDTAKLKENAYDLLMATA